MRSFDLTPLFRSTVGFDRLADMLDSVSQFDTGVAYPPYNIERADDDNYRITLALAGFSPDEITITAEQNVLTVDGCGAVRARRHAGHRQSGDIRLPAPPGRADAVETMGAP